MAPSLLRIRRGCHLRDQRCLPDRCERIAQLVRKRRQKLIFAPVGLAQRGFGLFSPCDLCLCQQLPRVAGQLHHETP